MQKKQYVWNIKKNKLSVSVYDMGINVIAEITTFSKLCFATFFMSKKTTWMHDCFRLLYYADVTPFNSIPASAKQQETTPSL